MSDFTNSRTGIACRRVLPPERAARRCADGLGARPGAAIGGGSYDISVSVLLRPRPRAVRDDAGAQRVGACSFLIVAAKPWNCARVPALPVAGDVRIGPAGPSSHRHLVTIVTQITATIRALVAGLQRCSGSGCPRGRATPRSQVHEAPRSAACTCEASPRGSGCPSATGILIEQLRCGPDHPSRTGNVACRVTPKNDRPGCHTHWNRR